MPAPRLAIRGLRKSFASIAALNGIDLELWPGELHVLAGENGAGKSTLIRVLSGAYSDYEGEILLDGRPLRLTRPLDAARAGIATIHQELTLVGSLSVADNFLLQRSGALFARADRRGARAAAKGALEALGVAIDPDALVESLSLGERQLIEIARALTRSAQILILDEPTSALSAPDAERLFEHLSRLRREGRTLLYISHRMDEIFRLSDKITVLRDGKTVHQRKPSETSPDEIVYALLGRRPERPSPVSVRSEASPLLAVRGLASAPALSPVSFTAYGGEVLGLAGLEGSGVRQLLWALAGAIEPQSGELELSGAPFSPKNPRAALAAGVAFVPGDRGLGVFPDLDGVKNATLSSLRAYSPYGLIEPRRERLAAEREALRFRLQSSALEVAAATLSGGNQQKLVLIRCLLAAPRLLLLDDPTRGIDVGAKAEVHRALRELASSGVSVVIHSSELDELGLVCDRVLGFYRGTLVVEAAAGAFDRERLLSALMGRAA